MILLLAQMISCAADLHHFRHWVREKPSRAPRHVSNSSAASQAQYLVIKLTNSHVLYWCVGVTDVGWRSTPKLVADVSGSVGEACCGGSHTLLLSTDGQTVWSFGSGDGGKILYF